MYIIAINILNQNLAPGQVTEIGSFLDFHTKSGYDFEGRFEVTENGDLFYFRNNTLEKIDFFALKNNINNFMCNTYSGDLNDIEKVGIYNVSNGVLNVPPQCNEWCFVLHLAHPYSTVHATQIAITMNSSDFLCFRTKSYAWSVWKTIYDINTVK